MAEVFHIIDASSRDAITNSMTMALGRDGVARPTPDCVLLRRDGIEIPIEDSVAPIHDRDGQATGAVIVVRDVSAEGDRPAKGWLAWALETRNAVIHRAPLLHVWLNRPGRRPGGRQLFVRTAEQPAHLMRMEPHMRREPWLPDMHALSEAGLAAADLWLPEPTQNTLGHLKNGAVRVLECVANDLLELWGTSMPAFSWPVDAWKLERRDHSRRVQLAAQFEGFEQNYPTPPPSTMHAHPHTSARAVLSDGVRARQASQPGST